MNNTADPCPHVYTIGHSNQDLDALIRLLKNEHIELLIDVRTYPISRFAPHFNRSNLERALPDRSIHYRFAGKQLGGRPDGEEFYDSEGHVLYSRVAEADFFRDGIEQLERVLPKYRTAIMCSEENPVNCHRRLLIGRVLLERGITLFHIRATGDLQEEAPATRQMLHASVGQAALPLFEASRTDAWRSVRSVLRRDPPETSSGH